MVKTEALNIPIKNIDGCEEQSSITSKPFTGRRILKILSLNAAISNSSVYEFGNIQEKVVGTNRASYYFSFANVYNTYAL